MTGTLTLLAQAALYFLLMAALFRARARLGIGVFVCVLGVMHFLETYLAAVFFVPLPFGLISPGSTVLFSGKLMMLLMLYIKLDAETVRQPIYGLLVGNFLVVGLVFLLRFMPHMVLNGQPPDFQFLDQMGVLMVWGTLLLFVDAIALVLLYEALGKRLTRRFLPRAFVASALVLSFDQLAFFAGLHFETGAPLSALTGGWIAKMGAAAVYSLMIGAYFRWFEASDAQTEPQPVADVFDRLTYRERYEDLLKRAGIDSLTGAKDRGEFEVLGQQQLDVAQASGTGVSLLMIDIDHFKDVNDRHGHVVGDTVLRGVASALAASIRAGDTLFRYGGEEFAITCEGLSHRGAIALADRLRVAVQESLRPEGVTTLTASFGVATFPAHGTDIVSLVRSADGNLYKAKQAGRNRVVGFPLVAAA